MECTRGRRDACDGRGVSRTGQHCNCTAMGLRNEHACCMRAVKAPFHEALVCPMKSAF